MGALPHVFLYNVDDLQKILDETLDRRQVAAVAAETLVAGEAGAFASWQRSLAVVPAIRELRERGELTRAREVERLLGRMPHLSEADRAAIEAFSHRLLNQLLHEPTVRLREAAEEGNADEAAGRGPLSVRERLSMNVLVTGGAGFIGSHVSRGFPRAG